MHFYRASSLKWRMCELACNENGTPVYNYTHACGRAKLFHSPEIERAQGG